MKDDDIVRSKIHFRITRDEDGYPPFEWENLWAEPCGDGRWRLDNVPFFINDVNFGDIIEADQDEDAQEGEARLVFRQVLERSGHATLRVIFEDLSVVEKVREQLKALGCSTEGGHAERLLAVDVFPEAVMVDIWAYLEAEAQRSGLEFEEARSDDVRNDDSVTLH